MARIDREKFSIRQKTNLLSHATKARRSYWNLYAQKTLMQISQNELRRSNDLLEVKRNEFKIGEASVLDTMSAALEMLKAQQGLITSTVELDNAKNELALDVTLSSDSIDISDSVDFHISDLPPADSLIKMVEDYDPELRIFERAAEQIRIQSEQSKNSLLPSLDFSATLSRSLAGNKYLSENVANRNAVFALILKYALPQTRTQNSFKQLQYNAEKNELTKENYRAELRNRLSQLQLKWQLEKSRIAISEAARELAAKQLVAYEKRYELGTADRLELLKARDDLISAEIDLLRSRINMKNLEITFDELTGGLFYRFGVNLQ